MPHRSKVVEVQLSHRRPLEDRLPFGQVQAIPRLLEVREDLAIMERLVS